MATLQEAQAIAADLTAPDRLQLLAGLIPELPPEDQAVLLATVGADSVEQFVKSTKVAALRTAMVPEAIGITADIADWPALETALATAAPAGLPHPGDIRQDIQGEIAANVTA